MPVAADAVPIPEVLPTSKPDWYDAADEKAQLANYLVTAAKLVNDEDPKGDPPLWDPARITKKEFQAALMDSLANPVNGGGRRRTKATELNKYLGVKEGPVDLGHHHAGLQFYKQKHSFNPFKLAMRQRHGIATHWSTSHTEFHTIARYLHMATERKPVVDRDPVKWTRDGKELNMFEECQEPFNAKAWVASRERQASQPLPTKKQKKEQRFTHLDFKALVLKENLLTPNAVMAHFLEKGSFEMRLWVSGHQQKLRQLIQEAVDLGAASTEAKLEKESEWQIIERRAKDGTCACGASGCVWWAMALQFFKRNKRIDKERLAAAIRKIICFGPSKDVPVPLLIGDKNCAKSTMADPVINVFGKEHVHPKPKLGAPNGAYGELAEGKIRIMYWDDYRPVDYAAIPENNPTVPVTDFLALFQGQTVKVQVSQSFNNGHPKLAWKKGVLMTAKAKGLWSPVGNVSEEEITHMKARVDCYYATGKVGNKPEDFQTSPACPNPWCRWVVTDSIAYAARQGPRCLGSLGNKVQPVALPEMPSDTAAAPSGLSEAMKAKIEDNRQEAMKRKREREEAEASSWPMEFEGHDEGEEYPDMYAEDELWDGAGIDEME